MNATGKYFTADELRCKCGCGTNGMKQRTVDRLDRLREVVGFPIVINSGYRCEQYNRDIGATQTHSSGQAVDIGCSHKKALLIVEAALSIGFTGIGVNQRGNSRFIHLDDLPEAEGQPRPHIWSY